MKKWFIIIAGMLLISTSIGNAINFNKYLKDKEGDVNDQDVDIIEAHSIFTKGNILLTLIVAGKINNSCIYTFTLTDGKNEIGVVYTNKKAYYPSEIKEKVDYEIKNNTLILKVPSKIFKSWKKFDFNVMATDKKGEWDYVSSFNDTLKEDPAQKKPTDKNIQIKITYVRYDIRRIEENRWHAKYLIKGITNGVDHVSLNFVTYYHNGSFKKDDWIRGPIEIYNKSILGSKIKVFYFNSTKGNWKKWKFEVEATYFVNESRFEWTRQKDEIEKYSVIARAFKDSKEKKWNQFVYDTKPIFTQDGAYYIPKKSPYLALPFLIFLLFIIVLGKKGRDKI